MTKTTHATEINYPRKEVLISCYQILRYKSIIGERLAMRAKDKSNTDQLCGSTDRHQKAQLENDDEVQPCQNRIHLFKTRS